MIDFMDICSSPNFCSFIFYCCWSHRPHLQGLKYCCMSRITHPSLCLCHLMSLSGKKYVPHTVRVVLVGQNLAALQPNVGWPGRQGGLRVCQSLTSLCHCPLCFHLPIHQIFVWKVSSTPGASTLLIVLFHNIHV